MQKILMKMCCFSSFVFCNACPGGSWWEGHRAGEQEGMPYQPDAACRAGVHSWHQCWHNVGCLPGQDPSPHGDTGPRPPGPWLAICHPPQQQRGGSGSGGRDRLFFLGKQWELICAHFFWDLQQVHSGWLFQACLHCLYYPDLISGFAFPSLLSLIIWKLFKLYSEPKWVLRTWLRGAGLCTHGGRDAFHQLPAVGMGTATSFPKNGWCKGFFSSSEEVLWQDPVFFFSLKSSDCSK